MTDYEETPARLTHGVEVTRVASGRHYILCKECFCTEYEIDESSLSTATAQPQDDLTVEKFLALTHIITCSRCHKRR